jgi:hypothetical protein
LLYHAGRLLAGEERIARPGKAQFLRACCAWSASMPAIRKWST